MTKQDYVAFAKILNARIPSDCARENDPLMAQALDTHTRLIAADMAEHFAKDNPRFNKERFLEACLKA